MSGPALRWLCAWAFLILFVMTLNAASIAPAPRGVEGWEKYVLDYERPVDPNAQRALEQLDATLRARWALKPEQTAVGWLDLRTLRLAMLRPDHIEYAASVPKVGILLAWFAQHPEAALDLDPPIRHRLGLMIKQSSNEEAAAFSRDLGLGTIQATLNRLGFYDASHGGGLWVGKHYGKDSERHGDPVADHSHAATVRQLLRFYLLLEQGLLISPAASARMREIFDSPEIPHVPDKFVQALADRGVQMRRKSGTWEQWQHDTAVVWGPDRYYILVALTHAPTGDDYLVALARGVDDWMKQASSNDGALGDRALPVPAAATALEDRSRSAVRVGKAPEKRDSPDFP